MKTKFNLLVLGLAVALLTGSVNFAFAQEAADQAPVRPEVVEAAPAADGPYEITYTDSQPRTHFVETSRPIHARRAKGLALLPIIFMFFFFGCFSLLTLVPYIIVLALVAKSRGIKNHVLFGFIALVPVVNYLAAIYVLSLPNVQQNQMQKRIEELEAKIG